MDKYAVFNEFGHNLGVDFVLANSKEEAASKVKEWFHETLKNVNVLLKVLRIF